VLDGGVGSTLQLDGALGGGEMTSKDEPPAINMSAISVAGIGGLGLVAVSLVMAFLYPQGRLLLATGALGGIAVAAALVFYRRRHRGSEPTGSNPVVLFRADALSSERLTGRADSRSHVIGYFGNLAVAFVLIGGGRVNPHNHEDSSNL